MSIITLTTDFGTADHYVAAMKGVLLSGAPKSALVDVTHEVARGGIMQGAFILAQLPRTFPPGTVHLAVIDPTVGSPRAILAVQAGGQFFVAPDNGLLTLVVQHWGCEALHVVPVPADGAASSTFHGRDIMAPAAAALSRRGQIAELGPATDRMQQLDLPAAADQPDGTLRGQVIYVDRFGNCVTNIGPDRLRDAIVRAPGLTIYAGGHCVGALKKTYADVEPNQPLALLGSCERLEIAVNLGSAAERLGLSPGSEIILRNE
ncbi:MAG: Adenosyl-chloride synthase [Phycisphaerae bacterium]|nr:Adenosyl-chloride synthase [Phycisphaerae bacterium]